MSNPFASGGANDGSGGGAGGAPGGSLPEPDSGKPTDPHFSQGVEYGHVSARVPEKVARGVFATGSIVLHGMHEFAIDFLQRMVPPPMLASRVIMPYSILASLVSAVEDNVEKYRGRFGAPPAPPAPPAGFVPPKIADVYQEMKLPDDAVIGAYANKVMITHTMGEYCFDFIGDFFPRPVVTARIYMTAAQGPLLLDSLKRTLAQLQANIAQQQSQQQQLFQQQRNAQQTPQPDQEPDQRPPAPPAPI